VNGFCCATSRRVQCHKPIVETVRTLGKIAATLGVIGAMAVGSVVPAAAWYGYGYHHRYYGYHHRYYHHRYYAYYPRHYHHRHWYRY